MPGALSGMEREYIRERTLEGHKPARSHGLFAITSLICTQLDAFTDSYWRLDYDLRPSCDTDLN